MEGNASTSDAAGPSGIIRGLTVERTPQEFLRVANEQLLLERTASGRIHPWQPRHLEVAEGIELLEAAAITPRRLFLDENDQYDPDDDFEDPLAEDLAVDSGSDEEEEPTAEELLNSLREEEDEVSESQDIGEFAWTGDYASFTATRERFSEEVGPRIGGTSPLDIFTQIWDQPLLDMIREQTDLYAWQTIVPLSVSETGISAHSRLNDWVETSVSELYCLIAVMVLMGICVRGQIGEYWSTGIMGMSGFQKTMSKNRFLLLMRFLHFNDNDTILGRGDERKCDKISPLVAYLNEKFKAVYSPRRQLSVEESLLLWKGRLSWVKCIRSKAARFGIKSYELCEAVTGYVLNIILYTGRDTGSLQPVGGFTSATAKVVLKLLGEDYIGRGYTIYMDNYFNSVELCRYLKLRATDVVGTLNRRLQKTPADMGGVDLKDQLLSGSLLERKRGMKWYIKVFRRLVNISILNSYIIYRSNIGQGQRLTHGQFRFKLVEQLLETYSTRTPITRPQAPVDVSCDRLNRSLPHYPYHSETETVCTANRQNKFKRAACVRCLATNDRRVLTSVICRHCKVFLCVGQCFIDYHNLEVL